VSAPIDVAKDAVAYALRRVGTDPEFRWHMIGTETLDRLCKAYAALTDRTSEDVMAEVRAHKPRPEVSRCEEHRDLLGAVREAIADLPSSDPHRERLMDVAHGRSGDE